ncbi:tetratricopeptide repeat protein [Shewanella woodyi]|uniref:tetratricopeptide repeat protein n=1 Tax=Shewanella woodyi TaxID=60961 RepID=UPI003748FD18
MRASLFFVSFFLMFSWNSAHAQDGIALEIKLNEDPTLLYEELISSITLPIDAANIDEFKQTAKAQGYEPQALKNKLQLLTRVYLDTSTKVQNKYLHSEKLIALLERVSENDFDKSYVNALKGRHIGRSKSDYTTAIKFYNKSIKLFNEENTTQSRILKIVIHKNLGTLHRLIRQDKPAQQHLNRYRESAYELKNNYLIAQAESALGHFYNRQGQLALALQHYSEALRLSNKENKPFLKANLKLKLARVYRDLKSWDEALKYADEASKDFKKLNKEGYQSSCMTVMAMVHANQGQWNQAIDYYLTAQQLDLKSENLTSQALNYHNLGEAYFHNGNPQSALEFLFKSNALFMERKSKHYLVYNELLIAEVALAQKEFSLADKHSVLALSNAVALSLHDEQIQALQYRSQALRGLEDFSQAFEVLDKLILLNQNPPEKASTVEPFAASVLTEQKLKIQLTQLKGQQDTLNTQVARSRILLITAFILTFLLTLLSINLWRRAKSLTSELTEAELKSVNEPITGLPGYRGFTNELNGKVKPSYIALLSLTDLLDDDLSQGVQNNTESINLIFNQLSSSFNSGVYLIRPGLFLLTIHESISPSALFEKCQNIICSCDIKTTIHMGILPLPLLADLEIKISPKTHFGTAQFSLAGALSLGKDKDHFVMLKSLNFAPPAIFSTPLFLHLEKGIKRGLLKIETNGDKTQLSWPKWKSHENFEI